MDIEGRVAVVTGGGSGIGRSLCLAFADRGADAVVVADVDGASAAETAESVRAHGGRAMAVTTDVARESAVQALVAAGEEAYGRIDLFCSNAGVIVAGGIETPNEVWDRVWDVNVQSHIYAARAVLPGMLQRGGGHLVFTASAAGLLTQIGSMSYAVSKHAVVALAEWISIAYGDRGIGVSCLCPQAVTTNLAATSRRQVSGSPEPAALFASGPTNQAAVDGVLTSDEVAACVAEALRADRFLILPHPEVATYERRRAADRERWLAGMRRLRARLGGAGDG